MNQAIRKNIRSLNSLVKELEVLQIRAAKKTGVWFRKPIDPQILKQRSTDLELIRQHVKQVVLMDKKRFISKERKKFKDHSNPSKSLDEMKDECIQ